MRRIKSAFGLAKEVVKRKLAKDAVHSDTDAELSKEGAEAAVICILKSEL